MRTLLLTLSAFLLLLTVPACGGGSGGSPLASAPQAMVLGVVVSRDGSSTELDGVRIESEDGATLAVTDRDGRFEAPVRAGRRFRLRFHDPRAAGAVLDDDVGEKRDETPDDTDIDGDELEIDELDEDEVCEVEVELEDGEVVGSWVEREKDGDDGQRHREHDGESPLCPPEGKDEDGPRGEIELGGEEDCLRLEIEAEGLIDYDLLEAVIEMPDGTEASIGILEIDDEGEVHHVFEACGADELPFGVEDVTGLAGAKLWIVDDLGDIVLMGKLPMRRGEHDADREKDDDEKEDGEDDDDKDGDDRPKPRVEDFKLASAVEDSDAKGGGVVKCYPECCVLVVEVGYLEGPAVYDIVLLDENEDEAELGALEVGEEGHGRFAEEYCDELPFDAGSLPDLAGYYLLVVDADGTIVLEGALPEFPAEEEQPGEGDKPDDEPEEKSEEKPESDEK